MSTTIRVGRMQLYTADNNSRIIFFNAYKITKDEYLFISTFLVKETTQVSKKYDINIRAQLGLIQSCVRFGKLRIHQN